MADDDWRVELDVPEHHGVLDTVREHRLVKEARQRLGDDVVVTMDDDRLYAYAGSEELAREIERRLQELAAARKLEHARVTVARWHPEEQRWEPLSDALPASPAEHDAERRARDAQQETEAKERGYPEWEVRIELADHDAAQDVERRLRTQGMSVVCRARVVVVACASEDDARALAQRLRGEIPEAQRIAAEGSAAVAMDEINPLSVITGRWRRT
jgi:hypothetical protein